MNDSTSRGDIIDYVVIDDISRFALHVWLSLTDAISIGIGRYKDVDKLFWVDDTTPKPLETSDGGARIWWVPATASWRRRLKCVLEVSTREYLTTPGCFFFIFDVKGKSEQYQVGKAFQAVGELIAGKRFLIVSSYGLGRIKIEGLIKPVQIFPKSPATLSKLPRGLERQEFVTESDSHANILVTGAGFEIKRSEPKGGFGLPPTACILQEMDDRLISKYFRHPVDQFPVPGRKLKIDAGLKKRIRNIAKHNDLDEYWNIILENQHEWYRQIESKKYVESGQAGRSERGYSVPHAAEVRKQEAWRREFAMRDSFRRSILRHDWGHLSQCLAAGKQDWHAWLTTNYTHFSDRAVALLGDHPGEWANRPSWRIVATANEAAVFLREQRHSQEHSDGSNNEEHRFLFKLHGDIGRLQTMAIAGQDKEVFGNLSVPIDSLHQVYSAVEFYLARTLRTAKKDRWKHVVWHIVGHGLQDRRLLRIIEETCRATHDKKSEFIVVNLAEEVDKVASKLYGFLAAEKVYCPERHKIRVCKGTAEEYMAALDSCAGLCAGEVEDWFQRVPLPKGEWLAPGD